MTRFYASYLSIGTFGFFSAAISCISVFVVLNKFLNLFSEIILSFQVVYNSLLNFMWMLKKD